MLDMSPEELFDHAARKDVAYGHKPSMLQDVEAGRETEIDFLNGAIVAFGERYGVDAPLNRALTQLVKGRRGSDDEPGGDRPAVRERPRRRRRRTASTPSSSPAPSTRASRARCATSPASGSSTATRTSSCRSRASPSVVFPKEARWVGDHGEAWIEDKVFAEHPGQWIAEPRVQNRSASTGSTT